MSDLILRIVAQVTLNAPAIQFQFTLAVAGPPSLVLCDDDGHICRTKREINGDKDVDGLTLRPPPPHLSSVVHSLSQSGP